MSTLRRLLLILTSLAVMLATCACSLGTVTNDEDEASTPEATTTAATTAEASTSATTAATTEAEDEEPEVDFGKILESVEDGVYINEYFDVSFMPGSTWFFYDDDQLLEFMDINSDSITTDEQRLEVLSELQVVYCAMSVDLTTGANIIMEVEDLTFSPNGTCYDAPTYAEFNANQFELSGYTIESIDTITVGSNEYSRVVCTIVSEGLEITQELLFKRVDDYMFGMIITVYDGFNVTADDVIAMVSDAS